MEISVVDILFLTLIICLSSVFLFVLLRALVHSKVILLRSFPGSIFGVIRLYKLPTGEVWVNTNRTAQGIDVRTFVNTESYWHHIAKVVSSYLRSYGGKRVLHLGLGAATIPYLVAQEVEGSTHMVVDIDEALIKVVRDELEIGVIESIRFMQDDVFAQVSEKRVFETRFDAVVIDNFAHFDKQTDKQQKQQVVGYYRSLMGEHGMIAFNHPVHSPALMVEAMEIVSLMEEMFGEKAVRWNKVVDRVRRFHNVVIFVEF